MQKRKIKWNEVLGLGESAAVSAAELAARLGITDKREVRRKVAEARLAGVPVCSLQRSDKGSGGYFLPDESKPEEVKHCIAEFRKRAVSSLMIAARLSRWSDPGWEQMTITDFLKEEGAEVEQI